MKVISENYRKSENGAMMPFLNYILQIHGVVRILLVVTFGILGFYAHSFCLSDSWVHFAEILVNLNTF